MLDLSMKQPQLLDAGVRDWNETAWGPHAGRVKDMMPWQDQVGAGMSFVTQGSRR